MIREAKYGDCINLTALSLQVWFETYAVDGINTEVSTYGLSLFSPDYFKQVLADPKYRLLVCVENDYLRGYVLVNLESAFENKGTGFEIEKLYVQGPFQGRGIGRKLLDEIRVLYGSAFWLYTWVRNKSIGFYRHYGFKDIGRYDLVFESGAVENRVLAYRTETAENTSGRFMQ